MDDATSRCGSWVIPKAVLPRNCRDCLPQRFLELSAPHPSLGLAGPLPTYSVSDPMFFIKSLQLDQMFVPPTPKFTE